MALPPEHRALLEQMAELLRGGTRHRFLEAAVVEPTPAFYPDEWEPTLRGVYALLRRSLTHAGLHDIGVRLVDARDLVESVSVSFEELDGPVAVFRVEAGEGTVATFLRSPPVTHTHTHAPENTARRGWG